MKTDEKKSWAEEVLRKKYTELGRIPTKKDFDDVTCSRIKAYLGTWPQALLAAGLREPKKKEPVRKHKSPDAEKCREN